MKCPYLSPPPPPHPPTLQASKGGNIIDHNLHWVLEERIVKELYMSECHCQGVHYMYVM